MIPIIKGKNPDSKYVGCSISFRNLNHLTDSTLVLGNPDYYYGACPEQFDCQIWIELSGHIILSMQHNLPIVLNFFLVVKGPDGLASVAKRQACYDGVLGARRIHSLWQYGQDKSVFDNNVYTISFIYHDGILNMFTSYSSGSDTADRTEYYMTQIRSFFMTDNPDTFWEGATYYRNGKDWAKEQRDDAINQATKKANQNINEHADVNTNGTTTSQTY